MNIGDRVFINCPFDNSYFPLLKSNLFTTIYCGLHPLLSETRDSSEVRISQLIDLIRQSKYSIHDLSRVEPGELPRFNMPFELGLDLGAKIFGGKEKQILILERERYRYQKVLSDIAGQDIRAHADDPRQLIKQLRDWFYIQLNNSNLPNYTEIWSLYNEFQFDFRTDMQSEDLNPDYIWEIPFAQLIDMMRSWIENRKGKDPQLSIGFRQ